MMEPKTIRMVNELIQGQTRFCIESYKSNQPVCSDDIRALAELVSALNVPPEQPPGDTAPIVGFVVPADENPSGDGE